MFGKLEEKVIRFGLGFGLVASLLGAPILAPRAYADTNYYGKYDSGKEQEVGYVEWDEIKKASKYHKELEDMESSDPQYETTKDKRNKSVRKAIEKVGKKKDEDNGDKVYVVVEKDDPKVDGYECLDEDVKKKIEELEKDD